MKHILVGTKDGAFDIECTNMDHCEGELHFYINGQLVSLFKEWTFFKQMKDFPEQGREPELT